MLKFKMVTPDILEVEQVVMSASRTHRKFFYTNIRTWEDLTNPSASRQEGDFKVARKLDQGAIEWIEMYHLPRVKESM